MVIDQAVVHAPAIDTDRLEHTTRPARGFGGGGHAIAKAGKESRGVPPEVSVAVHRGVGEAMGLLQREQRRTKGADEDAAAAGAEIDSGAEGRRCAHDASR